MFTDPFPIMQQLAVLEAQSRTVENLATVALAESDGLGVQLRDLAADIRTATARLEKVVTP